MNICIIGTGKIAHEVISALHYEAREIGITGIYAHSNKEAADKLASEYDIPKVYTDYDQLLREDTADFLYLGIVNTAHYDYARRALLAGRNVIVEKPFTTTSREAEELVQLARDKGLWLFEAVTTLHLPNYQLMQELLPMIQPVRIVECNYSQYSSRYDRYLNGDVAPAFNPELGGGALNDLNIYNINAVVGLLGMPKAVHYYSNRGFNGVDTSGVLVLQYEGTTAVCTAAKDSSGQSAMTVQGEQGRMMVPTPPNEMGRMVLFKNRGSNVFQKNRYQSRLVHEFKHFQEMWQQGDREAMNHYLDLTLQVVKVLEMAK